MSSDEVDIEAAEEEADGNNRNSDSFDSSDSYDELEMSMDESELEDLLDLQSKRSPTEETSLIDKHIQKSSLKDLIQLSCYR